MTDPVPSVEGRLPPGTDLIRWIRLRRRLTASPERVFRAWADPEELARWFPEQVEGGLAVGTRSTLVWPDQRVWWEVVEARAGRRFVFHRPWDEADRLVTTVSVDLAAAGYGTTLHLEDGPFALTEPGALDAWAKALEGWGEALMLLRAHLDFSVDIRPHG
jgi:uncharacterized protein YndB with AHSA1/START domain